MGADTDKESETYEEWMDLDCLLVQFWESRLTPPEVIFTSEGEEQDSRRFAEHLLPEVTRRGMITLAQ